MMHEYYLKSGYYSWDNVIQTILTLKKHEDLIVKFNQVPRMPDYFKEREGDNDGQLADYGVGLTDGRAIHVKTYDGFYKMHWDEIDPENDPIGHLVHDAPHWLVAGALALIGGYLFLKNR